MSWLTVQIKTPTRWQTFWIDSENVQIEPEMVKALSSRVAPVLVREAVYKEWVAHPPCGCPRCRTNVR